MISIIVITIGGWKISLQHDIQTLGIGHWYCLVLMQRQSPWTNEIDDMFIILRKGNSFSLHSLFSGRWFASIHAYAAQNTLFSYPLTFSYYWFSLKWYWLECILIQNHPLSHWIRSRHLEFIFYIWCASETVWRYVGHNNCYSSCYDFIIEHKNMSSDGLWNMSLFGVLCLVFGVWSLEFGLGFNRNKSEAFFHLWPQGFWVICILLWLITMWYWILEC